MRMRLAMATLCIATIVTSASAQQTVKVGLIMTYSGQFAEPNVNAIWYLTRTSRSWLGKNETAVIVRINCFA